MSLFSQLDIATAQRFQQQQIDAMMVGVPQSAPCGMVTDQQMVQQDPATAMIQHAER